MFGQDSAGQMHNPDLQLVEIDVYHKIMYQKQLTQSANCIVSILAVLNKLN
jgi:hypothetical protein